MKYDTFNRRNPMVVSASQHVFQNNQQPKGLQNQGKTLNQACSLHSKMVSVLKNSPVMQKHAGEALDHDEVRKRAGSIMHQNEGINDFSSIGLATEINPNHSFVRQQIRTITPLREDESPSVIQLRSHLALMMRGSAHKYSIHYHNGAGVGGTLGFGDEEGGFSMISIQSNEI